MDSKVQKSEENDHLVSILTETKNFGLVLELKV